jgi:hypothetical protein
MNKVYVIECAGEYDGTTYLCGVYLTRKQAKEAYDAYERDNPYDYTYLYAVPVNQEIKDSEKLLVKDPDDNWVNEK